MANQMTTPISSIPIINDVKPNEDIQDPIVQEVLENMAENTNIELPNNNVEPKKIISQPKYNYPIENENKSILNNLYDKKIIIITFVMILIVIGVYSVQFEEIINKINISYIEDYKIYIKYIVLYILLYLIQKYDFKL